MKKILFTLIFLSVITFLNAQCVPDLVNYSTPGIYPSVPPGLPVGHAGQVYNGVITVIVPKDTVILSVPIPIDSIGFTGYHGLPPGFTVTPNNQTGYWWGDSAGCVLISGNPTIADTGTYPLVFYVDAHGGGFTLNDSVTKFILVIGPPLGVDDNELDNFYIIQNNPNPFSGYTEVNFHLQGNGQVGFSVYNMMGEKVYSKSIYGKQGLNSFRFDASELQQGIYLYKLETGNNTVTRRMIVSGR